MAKNLSVNVSDAGFDLMESAESVTSSRRLTLPNGRQYTVKAEGCPKGDGTEALADHYKTQAECRIARKLADVQAENGVIGDKGKANGVIAGRTLANILTAPKPSSRPLTHATPEPVKERGSNGVLQA